MKHTALLFQQMPHWEPIFWVSYVAWILMELWILRRDARAAEGRKADGGSRFVLFLLIPTALFGAFLSPRFVPQAHIPLPAEPMFYTAIGLLWTGIALRIWSVMTLGRFFRTSVFMLTDHKLVTSGPYRFLRHPSYTGALITMIGVGLAMGNWLSILASAGFIFLAFAWRIVIEEKALAETFGDEFQAHKRRTSAIIPFLW